MLTETLKIKARLMDFVKFNECYDGQICISTKKFQREIQVPVENLVKKLELKTQ